MRYLILLALLAVAGCADRLTGPCHAQYGVIPVADSLLLEKYYLLAEDGTIIDSVEVYCVYNRP
jgi:hypothetical protein